MSEENIALRLKFLIENLSLTSSQFADKCDIARPTLSQLLSGRNKKISNLIIEQIHKAYPALSVVWLLFGEGDMWSTTAGPESTNSNSTNPNYSDSDIQTTESNPPAGSGKDFNFQTSNETDGFQSVAASNNSQNGAFGKPANGNSKNGLKNPCENIASRMGDGTGSEYSKETGVNCRQNASVNSNNEIVNPNFCSAEILTQLGKIKEKTRKVVQITVYYDDSTFQTFYPNK